jgi:ribosomal-protein-alanine N-acetyltransferase
VPSFPTDDLVTDSFRLRRLLPGDAPDLARLRQDDATMRWSQPSGSTEAEAIAAIAAGDESWVNGEAAEFAIASLEQDRLIGTIILKFYGEARASLGYDVLPAARGQGIATRALTLLSNWAFTTFSDLVRQELWILPGNEPSFRVAEKAGFQREGVIRSRHLFDGEFSDVVSYSLLRSDPR